MRATLTIAVAAIVAACTAAPSPGPTSTAATVPPTSTEPTLPPSTTPVPTTTTTVPAPRAVAADPLPWPEPPEPGVAPEPGQTGVAVIARGGAGLSTEPDTEPFVVAREGLTFGVRNRVGDWLEVVTPCDTAAWLEARSVAFAPTAAPGEGFGSAVFVLDPGHGGPNLGATGPTGLGEPAVNLDIARRASDLLGQSNRIDWATGQILPGDDIPPAGAAWLTRTAGPPDADYEAGLFFRTELARLAGATALVSIHNNADPDGPFDGPGSEVFYSVTRPESRRLAGLLMEEFRRGFAPFDAAWVGDTDAGAKYRLRSDGSTDYYGILRNADVPAVIAEGAFISNESEEALLRTPEFRQAYADAIYRALVRFVLTDDPGSLYTEPYERFVDAGRGDPLPTCEIPAQP